MKGFMEEQLWLAPWYFLSSGSLNHHLWWGSLGVRANTYTNIIWEAVKTLMWCDITWFDLIWGLTSPARGFVNTRHQVVTLKMKRISKTLEIYKTWMYVSKLCAIIKAKFRDWKCWVSPQNLLKCLIPITPYRPVGWGDVLPPNKTMPWLRMLSSIPIWMLVIWRSISVTVNVNVKILCMWSRMYSSIIFSSRSALATAHCNVCQTHDHNPLSRFQHGIVQFLRLPTSVVSL